MNKFLDVPMKKEQDEDMEEDAEQTYGKWIPIVKSQRIEPFVSEYFTDNQTTVSIVTNIFIVMACMIIAAFIGVLLYWSYNRETALFIAIISGVTMCYAIMNLIYFVVESSKVSAVALRIYLGSSIFMVMLNILLVGYFVIRAMRKMSYRSSNSSSSSSSGYQSVPSYASTDDQ